MTEQENLMAPTGMICGLILMIFILGCLTYSCTQPSQLDHEKQAIRIIENNKMVACTKAGGSWMPVQVVWTNGRGSTIEMSCVTDKTLPLATKMNVRS